MKYIRRKKIYVLLYTLLIYLLFILILKALQYDRQFVDINDQIVLVTKNLLKNESNKKPIAFAILSVNLDTNLDFYVFYLPMVCLSWRLVNYEPIIIAVYLKSIQSNKLAQKTLEYLNLFEFKIVYLKSEPNYDRITSMLARLFVGSLSEDLIKQNDIIFQTDADLIPINKNYYNNFNNKDIFNSINLLDISSYKSPISKFKHKNKFYQMFYMAHIGMSKMKWYEIMKLNADSSFDFKSMLNSIKKNYDNTSVKKNKEIKRGDMNWFLDQFILSVNIADYLKANKNVTFLISNSRGIKLDRVWSDKEWLNTLKSKYNLINDVHLYHENYIDKMNNLILLFNKLFNNSMLINKYINEFIIIKKLLVK